jgi:hypothetical protein
MADASTTRRAAKRAADRTVPEDINLRGPLTYKRLWYIARDGAIAALEAASPPDQLTGDAAQDVFEAGFSACWAEVFARAGQVAPFPLDNATFERAWRIYLATREVAPAANDRHPITGEPL